MTTPTFIVAATATSLASSLASRRFCKSIHIPARPTGWGQGGLILLQQRFQPPACTTEAEYPGCWRGRRSPLQDEREISTSNLGRHLSSGSRTDFDPTKRDHGFDSVLFTVRFSHVVFCHVKIENFLMTEKSYRSSGYICKYGSCQNYRMPQFNSSVPVSVYCTVICFQTSHQSGYISSI